MRQLPKRDTGWDFFFSGSIVPTLLVQDPSRATPGGGQHFVLLRAFSEACGPMGHTLRSRGYLWGTWSH